MFSKCIKLIFSIFFICGLFPELSKSARRISRIYSNIVFGFHLFLTILWTLYSLLLLSWLKVLMILMNHFDVYKDVSMPFLEFINKFVPFICASIMYWILLIKAYTQRGSQHMLWKLVQHIDKRYVQHKNIFFKYYSLKFIGYFVLCTIQCYVIFKYSSFPLWIVLTILFVTLPITSLSLIYQMGQFYYLFYVNLIKFELKMIENEVKQICAAYKLKYFWGIYNFHSQIGRFDRSRFLWIREYYQLIYQLSEVINLNFGWLISAIVLYCFCNIVCGLNEIANMRVELEVVSAVGLTILFHIVLSFFYICREASKCNLGVATSNIF